MFLNKKLCVQCLSVRHWEKNSEHERAEQLHVSHRLSPGLRRLRVGVCS